MRILIELDLQSKLTEKELSKLKTKAAQSGCDAGEVAANLIRAGLSISRKSKRKVPA